MSLKLNLFDESGNEVPPRRYSCGRDQLDTVAEILEAFGSDDVVALKGMVGSGKSVVGIRTILELGRGVVAVPTIWLSKQYATDYEKKKRFVNGARAVSVKFLKGRGNFDCPHAKDRAGEQVPGDRPGDNNHLSAAEKNLPCTRPLGDESRIVALRDCKYWGFIFPGDAKFNRSNIDSAFKSDDMTVPELRMRYSIESYKGLKNRDMSPAPWSLCTSERVCPYWEQFRAYISADCIAMNKDKWMSEVYIGRLPDVPITVVDEGDEFLDSITETVTLQERDVGMVIKWMESNITNLARAGRPELAEAEGKKVNLLEEGWNAVLDGERNPVGFICSLISSLKQMNTPRAEHLHWRAERIKKHKELAVYEIGDSKVTYAIPFPEVILGDLLSRVGGKWLLMSATFQSQEVLHEVYNIDPVFVEGERRFPGTLIEVITGAERRMSKKNWDATPGFREWFANTRRRILASMAKPGLEIIHSYKYLSEDEVKKIRETQNEMIRNFLDEPGGVLSTTKLDRGIDLTGMGVRSIFLHKFPYPNLGDLGLRSIRGRLGEGKFWRFYSDIARRDFLQQVGRVMRSDEDVVEFWSPDAVCHEKLPRIWKGRITKKHDQGVVGYKMS